MAPQFLFFRNQDFKGENGMMVNPNPRAVGNLRKIAEALDDRRLEVMLLASIACVTKEKSDILHVVSATREHGLHMDYVGKSLAIIVRTLARLHRFEEAREIISHMNGTSAFWHAEACISLVGFSGNEKDKDNAREAISHIRAPHLHNDANIDLGLAIENHRFSKAESFVIDLSELSSVLSKLEEFEDGHVIVPKANSAYLRLLAQEIIDRIFAKAMK